MRIKVDCQDCGNPNCGKADHTFTYEDYLKESDVKAAIEDIENDSYMTQAVLDALYELKSRLGIIRK